MISFGGYDASERNSPSQSPPIETTPFGGRIVRDMLLLNMSYHINFRNCTYRLLIMQPQYLDGILGQNLKSEFNALTKTEGISTISKHNRLHLAAYLAL